jgi:hypothetical protein
VIAWIALSLAVLADVVLLGTIAILLRLLRKAEPVLRAFFPSQS